MLDPLAEFFQMVVRNNGCAISKGGLSLWRKGEEGKMKRDTEKDVKEEIVFL